MGLPLCLEPQLADPASGVVQAVFGDVAQGYVVRMSPLHFEVEKSTYFSESMLLALFAVWMDGGIADVQALRAVTCQT